MNGSCFSPAVANSKSLREIQEEEAKRHEKAKEKNKQKVNASLPLSSAVTWGSKPGGWASEGAWGNAVKKTNWEQPIQAKPAKTISR